MVIYEYVYMEQDKKGVRRIDFNVTYRYIWYEHIPKGIIMRPEKYHVDVLLEAFRNHLVLSRDSITSILGTASKMTVFRKLKPLDYCTSYSHCGRFYALKELIPFNDHGLWSQDTIRFSRAGSLMQTIPLLVEQSPQGYFAAELRHLLEIKVQDALVKLYHENRLRRQQVGGDYLYLFPSLHQDQLRRREQLISEAQSDSQQQYGIDPDVVKHMRCLLAILNEKQRRLYLGFEAIRRGDGGDATLSRMSGVNVKTIARGRHELMQGDVGDERIRAVGAGRPALKKSPRL